MPPKRATCREGAMRGRGARVDLHTKIFDHFLKRDPPMFSEADSPIQSLELIRDLEAIFEPMGINGELRTKFAVYRFHGGARDWWKNAHRSLVATGQTPVTWDRFVNLFRDNYCLSTHMSALERELVQLKQESKNINDYEKRFSELCRLLLEVHANERNKIERFSEGMNWEIRTRLSVMNFGTFHEILNATLQVDLELTEFRTIGEKRGRQDMPRMSGQINSGSQGRPSQRSRFIHNQFGTPAANSRFSSAGSMPRPSNRLEAYRDRRWNTRRSWRTVRGRGNLGREAESNRSGAVAETSQGGVGAGQGRMFSMAEQEAQDFPNVATVNHILG
ncbi:hypothetical protein LIER_38088 [Lithospermum erythrorhizon]|uniref:Retrotransposon gag domain-containing protein n=1 Tax=Lithospermum erythrorhizon TaxID=34254 RepID=A0AAV3PUW1_LITER